MHAIAIMNRNCTLLIQILIQLYLIRQLDQLVNEKNEVAAALRTKTLQVQARPGADAEARAMTLDRRRALHLGGVPAQAIQYEEHGGALQVAEAPQPVPARPQSLRRQLELLLHLQLSEIHRYITSPVHGCCHGCAMILPRHLILHEFAIKIT